jgi:pimeloyl-ACP methyl ester carboxylesterase
MSRVFALVVVAACFLAGGAAAGAQEPTDAFYATPAKLPGKAHGDLIRQKTLTGVPAVAGAAKTKLLVYRSTDAHGRPVPVSGIVEVPKGKTPKGGWPVITWAHGTTGIADECAPSHDTATNSAHGYNAYIYPLYTRWLKAGYAVVRTDYQGLGTAGDHQYLIGVTEGRSVLDMIRAARRAMPHTLSADFAIGGHSQGGHAALYAAALAPRYTPELHLKATVAYAPASHLDEQIPLTVNITQANAGLTGLIATIGAGLAAGYATFDPATILSPAGLALEQEARTKCLGDVGAEATKQSLTPAGMFQHSADFTTIRQLLDANDPSHLKITSPLLIEQGTADQTVLPLFTDQLDKDLRTNGAHRITYTKVAGIDHAGITSGRGATDGTQYIEKRLKR